MLVVQVRVALAARTHFPDRTVYTLRAINAASIAAIYHRQPLEPIAALNRVLARMRNPRRRWLAPWLVLLMLCNQLALAQHVCRVGESSPALISSKAGHGHCDDSGQASAEAAAEQLACRMHCDDLPKLAKDPVSLQVPALPAASFVGPDVSQRAPAGAEFVPPIDTASGYRRRLHEFGVLLI
ncbi:MAG: hypothetical protein AB7E72_17420 [Lysobacterales bacterium]